MKRWMVATLLLASVAGYSRDPGTVLLLISRENGRNPELMLTKEVGVMVSMLKEAGYRVKVSAPSERVFMGTTTALKPDLKNAEVQVDDYAGFVLPCMAQPRGAEGVASEFLKLVKQIASSGKPLAAEMSSVDVLHKAGILEGKHVATQNSRPPVVQDGNLVTNMMCPYMALEMSEKDAVRELMAQFVALLQTTSRKP